VRDYWTLDYRLVNVSRLFDHAWLDYFFDNHRLYLFNDPLVNRLFDTWRKQLFSYFGVVLDRRVFDLLQFAYVPFWLQRRRNDTGSQLNVFAFDFSHERRFDVDLFDRLYDLSYFHLLALSVYNRLDFMRFDRTYFFYDPRWLRDSSNIDTTRRDLVLRGHMRIEELVDSRFIGIMAFDRKR